ncbi:Propionate catabolism operon regulatory protein [Escherichia coli]|uniref:Propionate catabolism operon regulatory protein n=1 Tax=Escherichia coli TaxID=562 RepID=A0A376L2Y1_ECOLX|nr:Propionate catabolism operon regulatory protein [Escherichia coli]
MRKGRLPARDAAVAPGCLKSPNGGTLFLDEIGEMPLPLQTRLLRVLEEKEVTRVGGHQPVPVDVRVISATHCNLEEDMRQGQFRRDLFYRLSILRLQLPPLRERVADILPLAESFLKVSLAALSAPFSAALRQGLQASETVLVHYDWPGNIRELRNMMGATGAIFKCGTDAGFKRRNFCSCYCRNWRASRRKLPLHAY